MPTMSPTMSAPKSATDQIREAIIKDGRDLAKIADAADVPYTSVYRFMHKGGGLKLETAEAIAKALGTRLRI